MQSHASGIRHTPIRICENFQTVSYADNHLFQPTIDSCSFCSLRNTQLALAPMAIY